MFCFKLLFIFFITVFLSGCATPLAVQSRVGSSIAVNDFAGAARLLDENPYLYGRNNTLLYLLDKGFVLHLLKDYPASINSFEKAKNKFDELYTKSITGFLSTLVINDYAASYRGEDFERVMVNIFQSINYCLSGSLEEALVEARQVDSKLLLINQNYKPNQQNVYKEDAFTRLLMGILYESSLTSQDYNDAYISYARADNIYEEDYIKNYHLGAPNLLKENLLTTAKFMGEEEFTKYRAKYNDVKFYTPQEKAKKAEIYLIQYNGYSPLKTEAIIPIPMPDGYIVQLAFPQYESRFYRTAGAVFIAKDQKGRPFKTVTELGEDLEAIARENLNNRKTRAVAKSIATSAGKYLIERKQEESIGKRSGDNTQAGFRILSSLFNIVTSRADLRSWQSLPSQIRIGRLLLDPGEYNFSVVSIDSQNQNLNEIDLGKIKVSAGDKKFFAVRSLL